MKDDFLNSIYKTVEMGIVGIDDVIDKVESEKLSNLLLEQRSEYEQILKSCEKVFSDYGIEGKNVSQASIISSKMMSEAKLLNKDDGYIAKMMMEGTNKGIIKINKGLNESKNDQEIRELAEDLLNIMENNLNELKIYL